MSLKNKLDTHRIQSEAKRPPHIKAAMEKATADLVASGQAGRALKQGDRAPAFDLPAPDGKSVSSAALLARGPLVITFYRGVWCPYCNLELQALQDALPEIQTAGGSLVAISPENAANSHKSVRQNELSFPILSDKGNAIADKFGLRFRLPDEIIAIYKGFGNDLPMVNGDDSWTLPIPGRFVIAPDGIIVYAEVNPDYTIRPEPSALMPALRQAAFRTAAA